MRGNWRSETLTALPRSWFLQDLLPHADRRGDGELDGLRALEGRARLPVGDVRVLVPGALDEAAGRDALVSLSCDESVEIEGRGLRHGK